MQRRSLKRYCPVLVAALTLAGSQTLVSQSTPAYPLRASANQRYLVDQAGVPFPIVGRALWELGSISIADRNMVLTDTVNRGYNAIEMRAPSRIPWSSRVPFDGDGNLPFLKRLDGTAYKGTLTYGNINNEAPDFTTPNEAYWSRLDALFNDCLARNLLVMYFPAYNGWKGGHDGWMSEMVANGTSRMQTYGAWVANRYKNQRNLVWLIAGDTGTVTEPYDAGARAAEEAFVSGLRSVAGQSTLISAEGANGSIATDLPGALADAISLNGSYSFYGYSAQQGRRAYARTPTIPSFQIEEPYDEEGPDGTNKNGAANQPVRRYQWWGWLSTIGGVMHGNGYVIHFTLSGWQNHLGTQATQDMTRQAAFMRSIPWYNLVPSGLGGARNLITAGGGTSDSQLYVAAAVTPDGSWLIAYIPPTHGGTITVDMGALGGPALARWFDPTTGVYSDIGTQLPNSGGRTFTRPGNNSRGQGDWVLVLSTGGTTTPPPGTPTNVRIIK